MRRADFLIAPFVMDAAIAVAGLMANLKAQDLGANPFQIGLLGVAWGLPYALSCPFTGRAAGLYDRRMLIVLGSLLYGVCTALYGLAGTPVGLLLAAPFGGIGCALFWPAFETLLHSDRPGQTRRNMGVFNIGWTLGILSGSAAGGYLYQQAGSRHAFWVLSAAVAANGLFVAYRTRRGLPAVAHSEEDSEAGARGLPVARRAGYMRMAWAANFTLWFSGAAVGTIFPKLARSLGIGDGPIGLLLASIMVAQGASFVFLSRTSRWHYRLAPMLVMQVVGACGLLGMALGASPALFALGLGMLGVARGLSYSASLYYGLDSAAARGLNAGLHEAIVGVSYVTGPFLAGWLAQTSTLRAPFLLAATVVLLGGAAEWLLWRRLPAFVSVDRSPELAQADA